MHFLIQTKSWSSAWNRLSTVSKLNQVISQRVHSVNDKRCKSFFNSWMEKSKFFQHAAHSIGFSISPFPTDQNSMRFQRIKINSSSPGMVKCHVISNGQKSFSWVLLVPKHAKCPDHFSS